MSDGEIEVESPSGYAILPKDVTDEIGSVKLFNKASRPPFSGASQHSNILQWSYEEVEVRDISLTYDTLALSLRTLYD